MTIIVTGAAGFIGSNFVNEWFKTSNEKVISYDKLTYAGNKKNLENQKNNINHLFVKGDINNLNKVSQIFKIHKPRAIINFAAESHVDRSISNADHFIKSNIFGVYNLLNVSYKFWLKLSSKEKLNFRFLHISTDEVYGDLSLSDKTFTEDNKYYPNSPYSASKASADHIVRAWNKTFGLPTLVTNCSNNYGPHQFNEKLIPLCISKALNGEKIPVYGNGKQIRDWLYVTDHCSAIRKVLENGAVGETYNIGGLCEIRNIDVVNKICEILDEIYPNKSKKSYKFQIKFVKDRLGHDFRYSVNIDKIFKELGWRPVETFNSGIRKTINWYLKNKIC